MTTANYNKATASYELAVKNHSYTSAVTDPTCTEKGYTTYTCSICGDSYEGDYTPILTIDVTDESIEIRPVLEPLTTVPESLAALYSTVDALSSEFLSRVTVSQGYTTENAAVYDIKLQFRVDGGEWVGATEDNFPLGGISVTLPYPAGTDASYEFTVAHMFTVTSDRLGITAGGADTITVTNTTEGMATAINGCSPIAITWKAADTSATPSPSPTATAAPTATATAPGTGDEAAPLLWLALLTLCGAGLGLAVGKRRRSR
ncbi:MAG: hypothetical protein LUG57_07535 [Oscillospiraceae bacterium]|nr:hypothetical protein [Oscillospiraceae bacterium]